MSNHPDNSKLSGVDFKGPVGNRKFTDVFFSVLIISHWITMTTLGWISLGWWENDAFGKGDPYKLLRGIDYEGSLCGRGDLDFKERLYTAYDPIDGTYWAICVQNCPENNGLIRTYDGTRTMPAYPSSSFLGYCLLDDAADAALNGGAIGASPLNGWEEIVADFWTAAPYFWWFGFMTTMLLGYGYLFLLRVSKFVNVLVWVSIACVGAACVIVGSVAIAESDEWKNEDPKTHSPSEYKGLKVCGSALYAVAFIWSCLMIFLRKRILLAIGVIKEASRSVVAMPLMMLFPFIQAFCVIIFFVIWLIYGAYLASSGELQASTVTSFGGDTTTVYSMEYSKRTKGALAFYIFALLWTFEYIQAVGQITLSLCVSTWYFARDKSAVGSKTLVSSLWKVSIYHMGTAAFGSLVIAVIKFARLIVGYLARRQGLMNSKNVLARAVVCCVECCLWLFEKCMKFLNENAYVYVAIFGTNFCTSARRAFFLILRNILRVAAVSLVSDFVLILGKVSIVSLSTGTAYLVMQQSIGKSLNGLVAPTILVGLIAWAIASMFCSVFSQAITTILQCFLADEEMFPVGSDRFASGDLVKFVDGHSLVQAAPPAVPADSVQVSPKKIEIEV